MHAARVRRRTPTTSPPTDEQVARSKVASGAASATASTCATQRGSHGCAPRARPAMNASSSTIAIEQRAPEQHEERRDEDRVEQRARRRDRQPSVTSTPRAASSAEQQRAPSAADAESVAAAVMRRDDNAAVSGRSQAPPRVARDERRDSAACRPRIRRGRLSQRRRAAAWPTSAWRSVSALSCRCARASALRPLRLRARR